MPARSVAGRKKRPRRFGAIFAEHATHVGAIFAAIAAIALLLWTRPPVLFPAETETVEAQPGAPIDEPVEATTGSTADAEWFSRLDESRGADDASRSIGVARLTAARIW